MKVSVHFSAGACFFAALLIMILPVRWWTGALLAATFHELCHLIAIRLTGTQLTGIIVGPFGSKIETEALSRGREVLCTAAGPMGSFLFACIMTSFPEASICAIVQGIYNLLPVYPLDGGRILCCVFSEPITTGIEMFAIVMMLGFGFWCVIHLNLGFLSMIPGSILAFRSCNIKFPCKAANIAVQ